MRDRIMHLLQTYKKGVSIAVLSNRLKAEPETIALVLGDMHKNGEAHCVEAGRVYSGRKVVFWHPSKRVARYAKPSTGSIVDEIEQECLTRQTKSYSATPYYPQGSTRSMR